MDKKVLSHAKEVLDQMTGTSMMEANQIINSIGFDTVMDYRVRSSVKGFLTGYNQSQLIEDTLNDVNAELVALMTNDAPFYSDMLDHYDSIFHQNGDTDFERQLQATLTNIRHDSNVYDRTDVDDNSDDPKVKAVNAYYENDYNYDTDVVYYDVATNDVTEVTVANIIDICKATYHELRKELNA